MWKQSSVLQKHIFQKKLKWLSKRHLTSVTSIRFSHHSNLEKSYKVSNHISSWMLSARKRDAKQFKLNLQQVLLMHSLYSKQHKWAPQGSILGSMVFSISQIIWKIGSGVPWPCLLTISNWAGKWTLRKGKPPWRMTWIGWKSGTKRTLWSPSRTSVKSCI